MPIPLFDLPKIADHSSSCKSRVGFPFVIFWLKRELVSTGQPSTTIDHPPSLAFYWKSATPPSFSSTMCIFFILKVEMRRCFSSIYVRAHISHFPSKLLLSLFLSEKYFPLLTSAVRAPIWVRTPKWIWLPFLAFHPLSNKPSYTCGYMWTPSTTSQIV